MKTLIAFAAFAFSMAGMAASLDASEGRRFDIGPQDVRTSLAQFAEQAGLSILLPANRLGSKQANALVGNYAIEEGLRLLLSGTGVSARLDASGQILVTRDASSDDANGRGEAEQKVPAHQVVFLPPTSDDLEAVPSTRGLQEVMVTARRREERLQDIPFSVSVLSALQLHDRNAETLLSLNGRFPNVSINTSTFSGLSGSLIRMRGIPDAIIYEDGVAVTGGALANAIDVERVEVLRGPQGTLFGRMALGGAIHVVTRQPSDNFWANADITLGDFDRNDVQASVNVPVTDTLFIKLNAAVLRRDGYVRSTAVDTSYGSKEDDQYGVDLLWQPNSLTDARLKYSRRQYRSNGNPLVNFALVPVCPGGSIPASWINREGVQQWTAPNTVCLLATVDSDLSVPGLQPLLSEFQSFGARKEYVTTVDGLDEGWGQRTDDVKLSLRRRLGAEWEMRALLSNTWGWQQSVSDLDGTGFDIFTLNHNDTADRQFLQDQRTVEFQLQHMGEKFNGVVGMYWQKDPGYVRRRISWIHSFLSDPLFQQLAVAQYGNGILSNPATTPSTADWVRGVRNSSDQWALFSEWTYSLTDAVRLTAGLRYTEVHAKSEQWTAEGGSAWGIEQVPVICCDLPGNLDDYYTPIRPADSVTRVPTFREYTPRFSLQYVGRQNWTAYLSYAKGTQPGGVNAAGPPGANLNSLYKQSSVHSYELGMKASFDDDKVAITAAAFFNDYNNVQVSEEMGYQPGFLTTSNADAITKGLELEGAWRITDALLIDYSWGYTDARYTEVSNLYNVDRGTRFQYTPRFNYDVGAEYRLGAFEGIVTMRADWAWQDQRLNQVDRLSQVRLAPYGVLNARTKFKIPGRMWEVALFGSNLTNTYYTTNAFLLPPDQSASGNLGRPREWGISLTLQVE